MIVYPLDNYNTFISKAEIITKLAEFGSGALWNAKTVPERESTLAISTALIKATCNITPNTCSFKEAQIMLIHLDLNNSGKYLALKDSNIAYKKAKVGSLSVEYNLSASSSSGLPSVVKSILNGCLKNGDKPIARGFDVN